MYICRAICRSVQITQVIALGFAVSYFERIHEGVGYCKATLKHTDVGAIATQVCEIVRLFNLQIFCRTK